MDFTKVKENEKKSVLEKKRDCRKGFLATKIPYSGNRGVN